MLNKVKDGFACEYQPATVNPRWDVYTSLIYVWKNLIKMEVLTHLHRDTIQLIWIKNG